MAKEKVGQVVRTEAVISNIDAGVHTEKLTFSTLSIPSKETCKTSEMVHNSSKIRLRIELPAPDENFPPIEGECTLVNYKTNVKCDKPNIKHLRLSTNQVGQIAGYVRAKQEVVVTFTEVNPGLPFEAERADEE